MIAELTVALDTKAVKPTPTAIEMLFPVVFTVADAAPNVCHVVPLSGLHSMNMRQVGSVPDTAPNSAVMIAPLLPGFLWVIPENETVLAPLSPVVVTVF